MAWSHIDGLEEKVGTSIVLDRSPCVCYPSSIIYRVRSSPWTRSRNRFVKVLGRIAHTLGLVGHATVQQQICTLQSVEVHHKDHPSPPPPSFPGPSLPTCHFPEAL